MLAMIGNAGNFGCDGFGGIGGFGGFGEVTMGVPVGIRTITEKREVCSDFIPEITPSVVCGWCDGRSGGSA